MIHSTLRSTLAASAATLVLAIAGSSPAMSQANDPDTLSTEVAEWPSLEKMFGKQIDENYKDGAAWQFRGTMRDNLKNYDGAVSDFTAAITIKNMNEKGGWKYLGYSFRGRSLNKKNEPLRALVDAIAACANAGDPIAWSVRGDAWYLMGNLEQAKTCLAKSLKLQPGRERNYTEVIAAKNAIEYQKHHKAVDTTGKLDTKVLFEKALAEEAAGKLDEAIRDYTEITEVQPLNGNAWGNRANLYLKAGRTDAAIADYSTCLTCHDIGKSVKDETTFLGNRAIAYSQSGHYTEAIIDLELALILTPGDVRATRLLKSMKEKQKPAKPTS